MPELPQELIDRIVDEFSGCIEDLQNLSLVNKSWLSRARSHLFRTLTLAPRDLKEINEYQAFLRRQSSSNGRRYYYPMSREERRLLRSPVIQKSQQLVLDSLSETIPYVRGLRLESTIQIGGTRKIPVADYFRRWLGFGGDEAAEESLLMRDLRFDESFHESQWKRFNSIDLPWGSNGLQGLPFRNLRYLHIEWSVFSWSSVPSSAPVPAKQWPGYQLERFLMANGETLDHLSIDEYPGFRLEELEESAMMDTLLLLVARSTPALRTLNLTGLLLPRYMNPSRDLRVAAPDNPEFVSRPRPLYPLDDQVPSVFSDLNYETLDPRSLSLERVFLRGFESESTLLLEDLLLNGRMLVGGRTKYLGLSAMPHDYNYKTFFSSLRHSLTHLTLDLDESTLQINIRFASFPQLQCLQLMIDPTNSPRRIISSLYASAYEGSQLSIRLGRLHFALPPETYFGAARRPLRPWTGIDKHLYEMITLFKTLEQVTLINVSVSELEPVLPLTIQTGCLKLQETDEWWRWPAYL